MQDDTTIVTADTSNGTDTITDTGVDTSLDADAKIKALEEQNKRLFERAKKAEGFVKNADGEWVKKTNAPQKTTEPITNPLKPTDILRSEEMRLFRQGYSDEEIEIIMRNGGMKILEDKNNPIVVGIQAIRQQRNAEDAASKVSDSASLSEVERKYTPEQLKNMSAADLEKILPRA